jgi:regulatory protein
VVVRASSAKPARTLKQRAVALLARREYSRAELAARLAAAGSPRDEIEQVLDELVRAGYLSDERFASAVVRQRQRRFAKRAIAQLLREKGVPASAANEALQSLAALDEIAAARALWQRRFGSAPTDERDKARQLRFLIARGYSTSVAWRVLRDAGAHLDGDRE